MPERYHRIMRGYENEQHDYAPVQRSKGLTTIEFIVNGNPTPQGDLAAGPHGRLYHKNAKLKPWREQVAAAAQSAMLGHWRKRKHELPERIPMFTGPVEVQIRFVLRRPTSAPKLKDVPAIKKPDVDKLMRAVLDAITGIVYTDDAQVVEIACGKRLAYYDEQPGCRIIVTGPTAEWDDHEQSR